MKNTFQLVIAFFGIVALFRASSEDAVQAAPLEERIDFSKQIQPIFKQYCYRCHGPEKQKSGLRLDQRKSALQGGDDGVAIIAGKSGESNLYRYVAGLDEDKKMPPSGPKPAREQIELIKKWIDEGAVWPEKAEAESEVWWSLKPLQRPAPPLAKKEWIRTPIDAFILAKLKEKGLSPAPEADRRTLIRRLYFDLTGLPPTPEEVDQFIGDADPQAYEKLVDRLLASPRYGERWARHWLDIVHYGETHGYDKDKPRPNAWPYRDYVIRALNEDKPYGRFVEEQLAGDLLYPGTRDGIEALGFIAAGPWDFIGHAELPESKIDGKIARHLDRDDMVANTINTFQSTTIHCAQCHNHKFDPISMEDYYSLHAVFAALDRADKPYDIDPQTARKRAELKVTRTLLQQEQKALYKKLHDRAGPKLAELEKAIQEKQKTVLSAFSLVIWLQLKQDRDHLIEIVTDEAIRHDQKRINKELQDVELELRSLPPIHYVYAGTVHTGSGTFVGTGANGGKPRPIYLLQRGNVQQPGKEVSPGTLTMLHHGPSRFALDASQPEGERRAQLAKWITHRDNPLTWRSIVNRIWQYHFGRGIVDSPNDFGRMGQLPSHPELLDWLAVEFRDQGQSLKKLHRLLVTSSVYRQASDVGRARLQPSRNLSIDPQSIDANNTYYWKMNRRRLEAEAVRDSILAVSGKLNLTIGGPSFQDYIIDKPEHSPHYEYHLFDPENPLGHRRSIYRSIVRSQQQPWMATLDCADPSLLVDKRNQSISPLQALALLNNDLVLVMAKHFAERVQSAGDVPAQVKLAFRLAVQRSPSEIELNQLVIYAKEQGMVNTCRVLLNLNEFVFID
jgi:mono/diheme cytochrome c family protein